MQILTQRQQVILAVGSTGTGKSLFGQCLGARDITSSKAAESETVEVKFHRTDNYIYIDTAGFLDSTYISNDSQIEKIYKALSDNGQQYVDTILWFCKPSIRSDSQLKNEANFITILGEGDELQKKYNNRRENRRNIWQNTIIVVKKSDEPETQGPLEAALSAQAYNAIKYTPPLVSLSISSSSHPSTGDFPKYLCENEVPNFFADLTKKHYHRENPISIVFLAVRCKNCPAKAADKRLMEKGCHLAESGRRHPKILELRHQKDSRYHIGKLGYSSELDGAKASGGTMALIGAVGGPAGSLFFGSVGFTLGAAVDGSLMLLRGKHWTCCGKKEKEIGCVFTCCREDSKGCQMTFRCCGGIQGDEGCEDGFCLSCKKMKTSSGCNNVFAHDVEPDM